MDLQLKGKSALITGSTAGIGFAIATGLAQEGVSVVLNGRTQTRLDQALARLREVAPQAQASGIAADLSSGPGMETLIQKLPEVDILVNNLGIFEAKAFEDLTDDDWRHFFDVNVLSGVRLSRHYLPQMKQRNWGRVVFISSEAGINIAPGMIHYSTTKTAQLALARGLAETTAGTGVTVNSILPGPTRSEGASVFLNRLAEQQGIDSKTVEKQFLQETYPFSLLQRFADPAEVAHLVTYICSPLSSATNGASLRVEGGVVRTLV